MDHSEVFEDTSKNQIGEWLDLVNFEVLCTAFGYARFSKGMQQMTGSGMKKSLTLQSLGWK